jgi:hypothetical protein
MTAAKTRPRREWAERHAEGNASQESPKRRFTMLFWQQIDKKINRAFIVKLQHLV